MNYEMVKKYIKRLKKMPPDFQFKFINAIADIEKGLFDKLDITELYWKENFYRCRIWKFKIIFYKNSTWEYKY